MGFDILSATKNITDKYIRYLKTMFDIEDPEYKKLFDQKMAEMGSFSKGPYLDVVDSFQSGSSVKQLISEGVLNSDFKYIEDIYNKTLYKHQEVSVRKLKSGKNVVVSTGTGSGKTESFLVPIINSLMEEKAEKGKITPGVRALLIYPMNALANDQIARLRSLLENYKDITFGSYTGQTQEKEERALSAYKALNNGKKPLKNELISRERMKETPPNILITNYSMLEYLMLRPRDNAFFQGEYAGNWRFVVLDEAHTYSGSTGIEVSMLLRRLKAYLNNKDIRFILTSATLGGEKANDEVAMFAQNLCDAPFSPDDVIRASRIKLMQDEENGITLSADDYKEMAQIVESGLSDEKIYESLKNHLQIAAEAKDYSEYLFDVLLRDTTFWRIKRFLNTPKTVAELCRAVDWDTKQVSDFVNVASKAVKNRKKLFDSRYHMFIRATDGVFVTLGNHKDLSLSRQTTKRVGNEEYKYFEIVTCNQCHAIYLLGAIESSADGKSYLRQKTNLAGDNIKEAFLLGDVISDEDDDSRLEDEHLQITNYELCPHCGFIRERGQVHKTKCEHDEKGYISLTKVKHSERTGRVTKCIKCEGTNNQGILRSFFSGQEASTSVVGTALFEELPNTEVQNIEIHEVEDNGFGFGDGFGSDFTETKLSSKAKQFIAFSDNRQAAAFFATYFYETYQGFLYSRIVYDNIKKLDETGKAITNFAKDMSSDFRNNKVSEMFDPSPDYLKESWKAIMKELIESYSRNSLIGLGLMKVDFADGVQLAPKGYSKGKISFTPDEVRNISLVLLRSLFEDNAIDHGQNFTDADIAFYSNNGSEKTYQLSSSDKYIRSFVPKSDSTTNKRYDYLQRVLASKGISAERENILVFMSDLWRYIFEKQEIVTDNADHSGKRVNLQKFKIVNTNKWYRCPKCHRITAYNVSNVCSAYKCNGTLKPVDIDAMEKDNHYYRIYNDLDIQPLRVVEHTAQLNSEEAYKLQDLFKRQEIDVLSCSTTFEMGVDIGDLETVFMRNMPPTPSNYVQRAGRAGRSVKSAALALTFCNKSNHDFSFFNNPVSMINGEIQPPLFKVENEKIGIRHLYSAALAFFWRKNSEYFGNAKDFFGDETASDGYQVFKDYLESKPAELKDYLLKAFPDQLIDKLEIGSFGWTRWLFDDPNISYPNLKNVFTQYRSEVDSLYKEKVRLEADNRSNYAIINRINTYTKENIISFLSRSNILPKYGFPVDTVELQVAGNKNNSLPIELSRDLAMAISEYAPGCEVIAAGNLIKSRYIKRMPNKLWRQFDYVQCSECKTINIAMHHEVKEEQSITECEHCGQKFNRGEIKTFLIPEFGFVSESKIEKPSLIKPDKTYRTEASMVAQGKTTWAGEYNVGDLKMSVTTMEDGEIAVLNKSDFYVCPSCGFTLGDFEANAFTPILKRPHKNTGDYHCKNEMLQRYSLGYRFKTDALHISVDDIYEYDEAYSILQAIILSACSSLNLDNNEIAGCLQSAMHGSTSSYDFVIYDTTPGGAGHVRRFADSNTMKKVIIGAYDKANNCDCGGEEGDSSCYKCLRTYQNQQHHDTLKRKYVIQHLKKAIEGADEGDNTRLKPIKKPVKEPTKKLELKTSGTGVSTETYDYIVSLLDLEDDELEIKIANAMRDAGARKPDYESMDFKVGDQEGIYADLVWVKKKVLVFSPDNTDSYHAAENTDYKCFLFDQNINIPDFINAIK